jgi:hypothetical protein
VSNRQSGHALLIIIISLVVVVLVAVLGFVFWQNFIKSGSGSTVSSFEECKSASGSSILTTYPEQCVTADGQTFTGPTGDAVDYVTYCTPAEKLCFEYRDDWKLESLEPFETEPGASVDNLRLVSPDEAFALTLTSGISGLGGTCSEEAAKDVTVLTPTPILALTGFEDEYNQDRAEVARTIFTSDTAGYIASLYVTTSPEYTEEGTYKYCGTGFSQYVSGKNSTISDDFEGAGVFRFGYTAASFYGEPEKSYETLDAAKAVYETDNYTQAATLLASLRYE